MLDADDARYSPFCGTYLLEDGRALFVGGFLGSTVLTLHDFGMRRIGTLAEPADPAPSTLTLYAGPTLWSHDPPEMTCTFALTGSGEAHELHLKEAGGAQHLGTRVPLTSETVRFANGDVSLAGTLFLPAHAEGSAPAPCVVLIHGSGPQTRACVRLHAEYFARHGIASLAYDKRGAGESSPGPDDFGLLGRDALAGLRAVAQHPRIDPHRIGLCGSSQGGWIAPMAAVEAPDEVAFVILVAGPAVSIAEQNRQNVEHTMRADGFPPEQVAAGVRQALAFNELVRTGEGWDEFRALSERARAEGWEKYALGLSITEPPPKPTNPRRGMDADPVLVLEKLSCPALALFGDRDTVVPAVENAPLMERALRRNGNPHHEVIVMPGANHLFHETAPAGTKGATAHPRRFFPAYLSRMAEWIAGLP